MSAKLCVRYTLTKSKDQVNRKGLPFITIDSFLDSSKMKALPNLASNRYTEERSVGGERVPCASSGSSLSICAHWPWFP